jgi:hypothetical protein
MKSLNTLARWIVVSSKDSSQVSLTIKGVLIGLIPYLMTISGLAHLNIGQDQLTGIFDTFASLVQAGLTLISYVVMFIGLARKLWNTIEVHQQATQPVQP